MSKVESKIAGFVQVVAVAVVVGALIGVLSAITFEVFDQGRKKANFTEKCVEEGGGVVMVNGVFMCLEVKRVF